DMIVGTSTGAILGSFYLIPNTNGKESDNSSLPSSKYPAAKALEFYTLEGRRIFNESKKHNWFGIRQIFNAVRFSPENIESIFQREFGDMKLHQLIKPCIITTYDIHNQRAFFFNSREDADKPREFYLRDVVRSTS